MPNDRETIREWLDSCKPLTAEAGAAMRRVLAFGPRMSHDVPALDVTLSPAGVLAVGCLDPSAPPVSEQTPGRTLPAEPMSLADNSLPPIDGTEAVSARGRSLIGGGA